MMEHIEPCGIHSGDSYAVLPTFDLSDNVRKQMIDITNKIAVALETVGLINIQFAIKDEVVCVIEANLELLEPFHLLLRHMMSRM